jgi:large subunit ribosomal protein L10
MPLTREQKHDRVDEYAAGLASAPHVFLVEYSGISVPQATELRAKLRESGGSYAVLSNRLALRAIEGKPLEELKAHFQGPTAAAWCEEDPVSLAKALTEFAKDVPAVGVKAGMVEGQTVEADQVKELASLPSREELIAKLLFLLQSPVTRFVRTLAEMPRRLVVVLGQISEKKS